MIRAVREVNPLFPEFPTMPTKASGGSKALARRIAELCDRLWSGNQRGMARDLRLSPQVIHRVVTGGKPPPGRLVEALAGRPDVDLNWLLRGDVPSSPPVANDVLANSPVNCPDDLSGVRFSPTEIPIRSSQYWLKVASHHAILRDGKYGVLAGDLLLMETDPRQFPPAEELDAQICAVRFKGSVVKLAAVTYVAGNEEDGPAHLDADPFDLRVRSHEIVRDSIVREFRGKSRRFTREYRYVGDGQNRKKIPLTDNDLEPILPEIAYEEIVAVCLVIVRLKT